MWKVWGMYLNSIQNFSTPNFQARIKMRSPKLNAVIDSAIGGTMATVGAASLADGAISYAAMSENVQSVPKEVLDSHQEFLYSASEDGMPAQSTVLPPAMMVSGGYSSFTGMRSFSDALLPSGKKDGGAEAKPELDKKIPS